MGSMNFKLIDGNIHNYLTVTFTIKLEVMSTVGAQQNEIQRRDTTLVKTNGPKMISPFDKVGYLTSASQIEHKSSERFKGDDRGDQTPPKRI